MKKLSKKQQAIKKLNNLGIFNLNDIDSQPDFDNSKQSRFTWLESKVGEMAIWIMNDIALMEFCKKNNQK
jgi:hypothetical protein